VPCEDSVYVTQDFRSWGQGVLTFSRVFFQSSNPGQLCSKLFKSQRFPDLGPNLVFFSFRFPPLFFSGGCLGIEAGLKRNGILNFFPFEINFFAGTFFYPLKVLGFIFEAIFPLFRIF